MDKKQYIHFPLPFTFFPYDLVLEITDLGRLSLKTQDYLKKSVIAYPMLGRHYILLVIVKFKMMPGLCSVACLWGNGEFQVIQSTSESLYLIFWISQNIIFMRVQTLLHPLLCLQCLESLFSMIRTVCRPDKYMFKDLLS